MASSSVSDDDEASVPPPSATAPAVATSSSGALHQLAPSAGSPSQPSSAITPPLQPPTSSTTAAAPPPTSQSGPPRSGPTSPTAPVGAQVDSLTQLLGTTHSAANMLVNCNSSNNNSGFLRRANASSSSGTAIAPPPPPPPPSLFLCALSHNSSIPFGASTSSSHDDVAFCFEPHCVEPNVCPRRHVHLTLTVAGASRLTLCEVPATLLRLTDGKSRLLETIRNGPRGSVVSNGRLPGASVTLDTAGSTLRLCRHPDLAACPHEHDCADAHLVDDAVLQRQPNTIWGCVQRLRAPLPPFLANASFRVVHKHSEMLSFPAQVTGAAPTQGLDESDAALVMAAGGGGNPTDVSIMTDNASSLTFGDHMPVVVVVKEQMLPEATAVVTQSDDESDK